MTLSKTITRDEAKRSIKDLFRQNVLGKIPDTSAAHKNHRGKSGHWLETQMGIRHNGKNEPDLLGFEMKNETLSKTTFGDWSASFYIFKSKNNKNSNLNRSQFLKIFGKPNALKGGRHSWSGDPCPKTGFYNDFGQKLFIDKDSNVIAYYSYSKDLRKNKHIIVPSEYQKENLIIAKWDSDHLRTKFEKKFKKFGWFKCFTGSNGKYEHIVFGQPLTFEYFIRQMRIGNVIFDSGMYDGNLRPYSMWRCNNDFWNSLPLDSESVSVMKKIAS